MYSEVSYTTFKYLLFTKFNTCRERERFVHYTEEYLPAVFNRLLKLTNIGSELFLLVLPTAT